MLWATQFNLVICSYFDSFYQLIHTIEVIFVKTRLEPETILS